MSAEFPLFWPKTRLGDFCSCKLWKWADAETVKTSECVPLHRLCAQFSHLAGADHADPCYEYLLGHRHVFPFASILARISDFSTLPTLERGRSFQTSICLGVLTLPTRCFTKVNTAE